MSAAAMPILFLVLLISMASGAISTSLVFKDASFSTLVENDKGIQEVGSITTQESDELSQSTDHTSQFDAQIGEDNLNTSQIEIAPDDLSLRVESLEKDNSYLKVKLKSMLSEYKEIKNQYHTLQSNYTKALENNSALEELMAYYEERIAFHNASTLLLKNKLSESISPPLHVYHRQGNFLGL